MMSSTHFDTRVKRYTATLAKEASRQPVRRNTLRRIRIALPCVVWLEVGDESVCVNVKSHRYPAALTVA
jgi:hypothetical protein